MSPIPWTTHQIARLKEHYPSASQEALERELAPHTWAAIQNMAYYLCLRRRAVARDWNAICAAHTPTFDFGRSAFK